MSGARLITMLSHELVRRGSATAWRRCASAWAGIATIIERIDGRETVD